MGFLHTLSLILFLVKALIGRFESHNDSSWDLNTGFDTETVLVILSFLLEQMRY